jgi:hypothetical protein
VETNYARVGKRIVSSKHTDGESTAGAPRIQSGIQVKTRNKVIKNNYEGAALVACKKSKEYREDKSDFKVSEQLTGSQGFSVNKK